MILRLDNGLTVVLEENHTAPVVAFQAWVRVGSADEPPALAGIAHVFEHMLFKGTKRRGVGAIAQEVESAGGEINAWTSYDETVYHLVLASEFFDAGLDILADALTSSTFDPEELERERKVVLEEIKQGLDDPDRMAIQGLFRAAFDVHPYGRPVIGSAESVTALRREALVRFFARHYVGANVTLAVVGDFEAGRAAEAVKRAFGGMARGRQMPARAPEPMRRAPRIVVAARDVKEAQILFGFRVPEITHEDIPALDLLAIVLGQGDSSRLNLEIVRRRELATTASAYVFSARDPGLFVVSANLPGARLEAAARVLLDETLRVAREEVSVGELSKARTILESDRIFDKETVQGYARKLGFFASVAGDVHFEEAYLARLHRVTPADLVTVGARYLRAERLTAFAQIAEPRAERRPAREERLQRRLAATVKSAAARGLRQAARATPPSPDRVARRVLASGAKVLVLRDATVPVVAVRATWLGGQRVEDSTTCGISNLLATLLPRGTNTRSAEEIMTTVEEMAGSLSGYSGRNSLGLQAEFLARHAERGLELVADCLVNATFSDEELEKERRLVLEDLRAQEDSLGHVTFQLFHETVWKSHPYRFDPLGTARSLRAMTRRKLLAHFQRHYRASNLTLAVVGDVDPDRVVAQLDALLGGRSSVPGGKAQEVSREQLPSRPARVERLLPKEQAHLVVGFPGTTLDASDRFPIEVLFQALAGQGGRLFVEIREKRALAYKISAFSLEGIDPGYLAVYVATSPDRLDESLAAIRAELERVRESGITTEELDRARRYLVGTHAIGLQRKSAVAAALAFHEAYGQGWQTYRQYGDRIMRVTREEVLKMARRYLDPRKEILAIVKPPAATVGRSKRAAGARSGAAELGKAAARSVAR